LRTVFQLASALTAHTLRPVYEAGLAAIGRGETQFDFSSVTALDSAAVAAMVGWRREALRHGARLDYLHVPASLSSLAQLYGVADLLRAGAPAERRDLPHH
jgi:phospholipid transport system transporter-binding protein